jgi:riboflavin synthase
MFTGIITNFGIVESIEKNCEKDLLLKILTQSSNISRKLDIGCSIACNGVCLTLIKKENIDDKYLLFFQASNETCSKTTLKNWQQNQEINLEFSLRVGDELGGHMVLGHVDNVAQIKSHIFKFEAPQDLIKFIIKKGSIVIDGVSLTINEVAGNIFSVNIISHTLQNTIFKNYKVGNYINLEIDVIARYSIERNS